MLGFQTGTRMVTAVLVTSLVTFVGAHRVTPIAWAEGDERLHAKGMNVLQATFKGCETVTGVSLCQSRDGVDFRPIDAGLAHPWTLLWSTTSNGSETTVSILAVARFAPGEEGFVFEERGEYELRFAVSCEGGSAHSRKVTRRLRVSQATPQDVQFLARLGDESFTQLLLEFLSRESQAAVSAESRAQVQEEIARAPSDFRAIVLIEQILECTQYEEPWTVAGKLGSVQRALQWGDALWELAQDIPDSSYAPYAAFYAGCCYMAGVGETIKRDHGTLVTPLAKEYPLFGKAEAALAFAVDHGDPYFQPRALHNQAFLFAVAADWTKCSDVMERGYAVTGTRGTARSRLESLDEQIQKARVEFARRSQPEQE